MRIGLLTSLWREGDLGVAEVRALRDEGWVEWVELWLPRSPRPFTADVREAVRTAAEALALPLSLHSEITTFFAHRDPAARERLLEAFLDTLRLAREVTAGVVTIHPPLALPAQAGGASRAGWTAEDRRLLAEATGDPEEAQAWFRELLESATAEASGPALALENMTPRPHDLRLNGAREVAAFVRGVDRPGVRMCLDLRKAHREGLAPEPFIGSEGPLLANVHAAGIGDEGRPGTVDEGAMDWVAALRALQDEAYAGPVVYEGPPAATRPSLRALHEARRMGGRGR